MRSAPLSVFSWWTASSGLLSTADTRGSPGRRGQVLVCDQLGLDGDADELVDGLHRVLDRCDAALASDTRRVDTTFTCLPTGDRQCAVRVSVPALMSRTRSCSSSSPYRTSNGSSSTSRRSSLPLVTSTIVWPAFRIAEPRLGVRQRTNLVERVQVCARQTVWFALVEVASHADVAVRQGEQRFRFGQKVEIERGFTDMPRLHGEHAAGDHRDINSARSVTTTSAPLRRNASA